MNHAVTTRWHHGVLVISCHGEFDLSAAGELTLAVSALPVPAQPAARPPGGTGPATAGKGRGARRPATRPRRAADAVVVDLADVTFLDCSALDVLVRLALRCGDDIRFLFAAPHAIVHRLLVVLSLDRIFVVTESFAEAIRLADVWAALADDDTAPADDNTSRGHPTSRSRPTTATVPHQPRQPHPPRRA